MAFDSTHHHVVLFPYMAKGHTIPILQLARLLLNHGSGGSGVPSITVTIFTTPRNQPFISDSLSDTLVNVITLPFPENITGIPPDVESTDKLPSMSLFVPFNRATKFLQPFFEEAVQNLNPKVTFIVSGGFLWWTSESAEKFKIPRFAFYGINCYSWSISTLVGKTNLFSRSEPENTEPVTIPEFPWIQVTKSDFDPAFFDLKPSDPTFELLMDHLKATNMSDGIIVNSFYELEPEFVDHCSKVGPKSWCVGPLCLADEPNQQKLNRTENKSVWIRWLDRKLEEGTPVLYVAFGTQAELSDEQIKEIALGLEDSKVNFLWVIRRDIKEIMGEEMEERVRERGMIIKEWVNQREILSHKSVEGFLSHCGWNSVLESICFEVPILTLPLMAEQPLNAKMVVEEIKIGIRSGSNGGIRRLVQREELTQKVKELMEGETGKMARKKVKEYAEMGKKAVNEGSGSSWKSLDMLLRELSGRKNQELAN